MGMRVGGFKGRLVCTWAACWSSIVVRVCHAVHQLYGDYCRQPTWATVPSYEKLQGRRQAGTDVCSPPKRAEMDEEAREMLRDGRLEVAGSVGKGGGSGAAGCGHCGVSENTSTCWATPASAVSPVNE